MGLGNNSRENLCGEEKIVAAYVRVLAQHGKAQRLEKFEIPRAVFLVSDVWTPESGLLTAAMKLKRKALETAFSAEIVGMYSGLENNNNNNSKNLNLPMTNSNIVTNV